MIPPLRFTFQPCGLHRPFEIHTYNMKTPSLSQLSPLALVPCLLSISTSASAAIECHPTAIPAPSSDMISLRGNCIDTITNMELAQGAEVWRVTSPAGDQPVGSRQIQGGTLTVAPPTIAGDHTYYITGIEDGYGGPINFGGESGYPHVTLTVEAACPAEGCSREQQAPDQLTTALTTVQTERMRSHLSQAEARLRLLRKGGAIPALDVRGIPLPAGSKDEPPEPRQRRLGFYVTGLDDYLRRSAVLGQSEFTSRTDALSIGADYRLNDAWAFGANIGASDSRVSFAGSASDQKSRGSQATAYASWSVTPESYLSATVSYEASKFDLTRDDGSGAVSFASPRGHGVGLSLSGGRDFVIGPWSVGPYVRWDRVGSSISAFQETGSESAVAVGAQRMRSDTLNLGAQTQLSIPVSWGLVLPHVRFELTRRKDTVQQAPTATLLTDNTPLLIPASGEIDRNYGAAAIGISGIGQSGVSWFADYESTVAQQGYRARRFSLGLRVEI